MAAAHCTPGAPYGVGAAAVARPRGSVQRRARQRRHAAVGRPRVRVAQALGRREGDGHAHGVGGHGVHGQRERQVAAREPEGQRHVHRQAAGARRRGAPRRGAEAARRAPDERRQGARPLDGRVHLVQALQQRAVDGVDVGGGDADGGGAEQRVPHGVRPAVRGEHRRRVGARGGRLGGGGRLRRADVGQRHGQHEARHELGAARQRRRRGAAQRRGAVEGHLHPLRRPPRGAPHRGHEVAHVGLPHRARQPLVGGAARHARQQLRVRRGHRRARPLHHVGD
jgi:hypothetical protein